MYRIYELIDLFTIKIDIWAIYRCLFKQIFEGIIIIITIASKKHKIKPNN